MSTFLSRALAPLLLVLHAALLVWAVIGLAEWFLPSVPWPPVANVLFPPWLLMLHWIAVLAASTLFLLGYTMRWSWTSNIMAGAYGFMAVVCAIETFGFLTHSLRFVAMAFEYGVYIALVFALKRAPILATRFDSVASTQNAGHHDATSGCAPSG